MSEYQFSNEMSSEDIAKISSTYYILRIVQSFNKGAILRMAFPLMLILFVLSFSHDDNGFIVIIAVIFILIGSLAKVKKQLAKFQRKQQFKFNDEGFVFVGYKQLEYKWNAVLNIVVGDDFLFIMSKQSELIPMKLTVFKDEQERDAFMDFLSEHVKMSQYSQTGQLSKEKFMEKIKHKRKRTLVKKQETPIYSKKKPNLKSAPVFDVKSDSKTVQRRSPSNVPAIIVIVIFIVSVAAYLFYHHQ